MDETKSEPWEVAWALHGFVCPFGDDKRAFRAGWEACAAFYDGKAQWADSPAAYMGAKPDAITPEDIYAAYPRKVGRGGALRAIRKALRLLVQSRDYMQEADTYLLNRTQAYAIATARWPAEEKQFIPHPATWFNRGSYDDDPKEWQRGTPATQIRAAN